MTDSQKWIDKRTVLFKLSRFNLNGKFEWCVLAIIVVTVTLSTLLKFDVTIISCGPYCKQHPERAYGLHVLKDTNYSRFDVAKATLIFLPSFKSPCIAENYTETNKVYSNNRFITAKYVHHRVLGDRLKEYSDNHRNGAIFEYINGTRKIKRRIRCLPYFMLLGVARRDVLKFGHILSLQNVLGPVKQSVAFWTRYRFEINATLADYMDLFDESVQNSFDKTVNIPKGNGPFDFSHVLYEYSMAAFSENILWRRNPYNYGLSEPRYLTAHDIHAVNPRLKLIIILRNPTERLYSSYFMFNGKSPQDFHSRVVASIEWWKQCTEVLKLPKRACVYGCATEKSYDACISQWIDKNRKWMGQKDDGSEVICQGMYSVFARDWLSAFPKENYLFLRAEDTDNNNYIFNDIVFPFLRMKLVTGGMYKQYIDRKSKNRGLLTMEIKTAMLNETKQLLDRFYEPFNRDLAALLGHDKWLWKD